MKESPRKKRPHRDLESMPHRTKRQKCNEEGVNTSSAVEDVDEELESTDQNDESGDMKETTDSDENTEGTQMFRKFVTTFSFENTCTIEPEIFANFATCSHW